MILRADSKAGSQRDGDGDGDGAGAVAVAAEVTAQSGDRDFFQHAASASTRGVINTIISKSALAP